MRTLHSTIWICVLVASAVSACGSAPRTEAPWRGLGDGVVHQLGNGGEISVRDDDRRLVHVQARDGRLFLNGDDVGPYANGQQIRFHADGTLTVDDEVRGSVLSD